MNPEVDLKFIPRQNAMIFAKFSLDGYEPASRVGTRQHSRENVTKFSGQTLFAWCLLHYACICCGYTPLDTEPLTFFVFLLVTEAQTRCRFVVVEELKIVEILYNSFFSQSCIHMFESCCHKRRIYTEEKAKIVAAVWGTEFFQFLAATVILQQNDLKHSLLNSAFSSYHPDWIHFFSSYHPARCL